MDAFVARHEREIAGVLACVDRVVITGNLTAIAHTGAMAACLAHQEIRLSGYPRWAEPLRD